MDIVSPTPVQIVALLVLFVGFLSIPTLAKAMGTTLDTLPMRFAAVIVILAVLPHDRLVALGLFLVIGGLYIQRHHDDVLSVIEKTPTSDGNLRFPVESIQDPAAMRALHHGGHAAESHDIMDFMPKSSAQDNEFEHTSNSSINMKSVLPTEPLGSSKSQNLFGEDMQAAQAMQRDNFNASA